MAANRDSRGKPFTRRLEKWARESADLQSLVQSARGLGTPEETAVRKYRRSSTGDVALPHPNISAYRHDLLTRRQRTLSTHLVVLLLLVPVLAGVGLAVDPLVAKLLIGALLLPVVALAAQRVAALTRLNAERHLTLRGGVADAWRDWVSARHVLESCDGASQARAALAANESRMQALVLVLGRAEAQPNHHDTEEHKSSREWVYRTAAKAVALARAEQELQEATQRQVDAGELSFAPDGDLDALDAALDTARELSRRPDPHPPGRRGLE